MERIAQVARETGYLDGIQDFRSVETYGYLPPDKVVALCTGSQGEPRAALARIAEDEHPEVTFSRGDRVIFSSRAIPGNEKAVMRVINGLVSQGIEVITDRTHLVHVSGHPRRAELEDMIGWVRPQILIPVHGEALHLAEHAALARRAGRRQGACRAATAIWCGSRPAVPAIIDEVPAGRLYKDGSLLVDAEERTVADRRRLGFAGIVSVALALTEQGRACGRSRGRADRHSGDRRPTAKPMAEIAYDAVVSSRRVPAAAAPARSRCGRRGGAARRARGGRRAAGTRSRSATCTC